MARLLDDWLFAFDVDDPRSSDAKRAFEALLNELHSRDCLRGFPTRIEYRHHAVKSCRERLRKNL